VATTRMPLSGACVGVHEASNEGGFLRSLYAMAKGLDLGSARSFKTSSEAVALSFRPMSDFRLQWSHAVDREFECLVCSLHCGLRSKKFQNRAILLVENGFFWGGGDSKEFVSGYVRLECEKTGVLFMWRHFFFTVRVLVVKVPYGFCQI
jgi:hypothetical protein